MLTLYQKQRGDNALEKDCSQSSFSLYCCTRTGQGIMTYLCMPVFLVAICLLFISDINKNPQQVDFCGYDFFTLYVWNTRGIYCY